MMIPTDLGEKMRARADADQLPSGHPLRDLADRFDRAAGGFFAEPPTVSVQAFMGCWARARKAWCEYSGEEIL